MKIGSGVLSSSSFTYKRQKVIISILFLAVPLILLLVFTYLPAINIFLYSFTKWDGFGTIDKYVGLQNYIDIFTKPEYFSVFSVSLFYFVGSIVQICLALYFATILSFNVRFKNLFKGILFFPSLINGVAIAFTFLYFFQPEGGLDTVVKALGVSNPPLWLGERSLINISLTGVSIWRYMGFNFVMFVGAIQSIPAEIYEASELDGAGRWQQFRYIILPGIRMILVLNLILSVKGALSVFEIPYVMTGGMNGSSTFVIQTVNTAFKNNKFGLGAAMAVVLLILIVIVTIFQNVVLNEKEDSQKL
ncbi:MAG: ABC transporter permease subunit [Anaerolineaceae bacterium]|nr:ABC transporter permease subunit [Anaerolineaceae bacterium]